MKTMIFKGITAAVVVVSDSCFKGEREDLTGKALVRSLKNKGAHILREEIVADDKDKIKKIIKFISDNLRIKLILTAGGTGLSPRDVTPEATCELIDRRVQGISELMRLDGFRKTKRAALSRGVAGIRKNSLIINLPGSPAGAIESFEAVADIIPHAFEMMKGSGHDHNALKEKA